MGLRDLINFIIILVIIFIFLFLIEKIIPEKEHYIDKEVSKNFIELCEKNGGLILEENFFGKITKSKCYYNNESFSFWFAGSELELKNKILIDNFNKNGK